MMMDDEFDRLNELLMTRFRLERLQHNNKRRKQMKDHLFEIGEYALMKFNDTQNKKTIWLHVEVVGIEEDGSYNIKILNYRSYGFDKQFVTNVDEGLLMKKPLRADFMPSNIIYNGKATIVFWNDGTKTVVKRAEGENHNLYNAFCAALAKKIFGTNSAVNRIVKSGTRQMTPKVRSLIDEMNKTIRKHNIQRITELKEKHHMSYAKIAERLGLPESQVRNLARKAKGRKENHE